MNMGASHLFETTFTALQAQGPLKTWSLIVTIFGDIAPAKEDHIDSQLLAALTAPFGVKPEALRVALHRLRKDGWLEAVKTGRRSSYHLSETGEALTRKAYARIYRDVQSGQGADWQIELLEDAAASGRAKTALIGANILVSPAPSTGAPLCLAAVDVPEWMRTALVSEAAQAEFAGYVAALEGLFPALASESLTEEARAALRFLVLHYWRRIVLRQPEAPEILLGQDWAGDAARRLTLKVFQDLPRPKLADLAALSIA
ncbi:MAG: PaaX family transcriptional regulator C-terminal domain-containing protein [Lentibacter algarum]|uniref:PaaX family transcriptional regulator C-terminal domain-containing protein n=1 Tax=Lentibacter algarum TaxID=576131 RepID=UPI0026F03AE8|nr:PaaX family transcriptional regulator C-terminal domain-containing protein [Lentibacter algarum]